jgi:molybdate transport system ATP-binding protein
LLQSIPQEEIMTLCLHVLKQLAHFSLDIAMACSPGTLTAVVGPSGAGKSTLVRMIAGLEKPDEGTISMDGVLWNKTSIRHFAPPQKRGIGLVFQEYTLFPHLSVRKNIAFAAKDKNCVQGLLNKFGIARVAESKPANISGGERQRAAFCQALAREPVLLLLDEPFSALDVATREELRQVLFNMKLELNIPIIHVTHDLDEAYYLADSIFAMEDGKVAPQWLERQHKRPKGPFPFRSCL